MSRLPELHPHYQHLSNNTKNIITSSSFELNSRSLYSNRIYLKKIPLCVCDSCCVLSERLISSAKKIYLPQKERKRNLYSHLSFWAKVKIRRIVLWILNFSPHLLIFIDRERESMGCNFINTHRITSQHTKKDWLTNSERIKEQKRKKRAEKYVNSKHDFWFFLIFLVLGEKIFKFFLFLQKIYQKYKKKLQIQTVIWWWGCQKKVLFLFWSSLNWLVTIYIQIKYIRSRFDMIGIG